MALDMDEFQKDTRPNLMRFNPVGMTLNDLSDLIETRRAGLSTKEIQADQKLKFNIQDLDQFMAKYSNGVTVRLVDSKDSKKPGTIVDELWTIQDIINGHPEMNKAVILSVENFCGSTVYRVYLP